MRDFHIELDLDIFCSVIVRSVIQYLRASVCFFSFSLEKHYLIH